MDPVMLARIQFAMTIGFHFLFPPISIGLGWLLVLTEWIGWRRNDPVWQRLGRFFGKIFALTFAMGVATGIVMEFQFGTNWAAYSRYVGDIFGAPLAAEGVFAFFMESSFLGLYLFGRGRVSPRTHWISILMVAVGATLSGFWIIVANSWQQTPAGYVINEAMGRAEMTSFAAAVFNPSTVVRYAHTILAACVTGAFFMAGISAWMIRRGRDAAAMQRSLKLAIAFGLAASILVIFPAGHEHAQQVAETQPEKFAAIEGLYETQQGGAPLVFFALPQAEPPRLHATIEIPKLLSWVTFGDVNAVIPGLDSFPEEDRPPLWLTFVSFHNMVLLGLLFVGTMGLGALLWWRGRLADRRFLGWLVLAAPLPLAANQLGWIAAEVGRQPWIVYKLLRTSEAVSVTVSAGTLLFSIVLFGLVYLALGSLYLFLLRREVEHGLPAAREEVA